MTHKSIADYEAVFQAIKDSFPPEWGPPLLEEVLCDYEKAVWKAIRKVFPGVNIRGCFFHWTQAVEERIKKEGLEDKNKTAEDQRVCRLLLALPLLPHSKIGPTFASLAAQATGRVKLVCHYMERQWINPDAFFSPNTWSQYQQHTRTTNSHEGWHNRLKSAAERKSKLNFYKLVELLHHQASLVPVQCALLCQEKLKQRTTPQAGWVNHNLFQLWDLYNGHEISIKELHVRVTEVMEGVSTQRLNDNIVTAVATLDQEEEE